MESANAPPLPWEATKHKAFPSVSIEASSSAGEQRAKPPMELPRQLLKDELDKITRWQIGEAATARAGALPSCAPPALSGSPARRGGCARWLAASLSGAAASLSGVRMCAFAGAIPVDAMGVGGGAFADSCQSHVEAAVDAARHTPSHALVCLTQSGNCRRDHVGTITPSLHAPGRSGMM